MKITDSCSVFWYKNETNFPLLSQVARVSLTAIATSVPSERAFSAGTNQIWSRRNRLSSSSVEKIMFLLTNLEAECGVSFLEEEKKNLFNMVQ
jgi:hypothetical protein